jgi:hypothetical protein
VVKTVEILQKWRNFSEVLNGMSKKKILFDDDKERKSAELLDQTTCEAGMPRGHFKC